MADYNVPITTIVTLVNGNLDNSNIASGAAIDGSKLASASVTSNQLVTGSPIQMVSTAFTNTTTGTTTIPLDTSIPQNTEGDQYMTQAITPKSATSVLVITATIFGAHTVLNADVIVALFQDSTANALAAVSATNPAANGRQVLTVTHTMVAGTTSATTFKVRIGGSSGGTFTFNGHSGGADFGAITKSSITITEYKA